MNNDLISREALKKAIKDNGYSHYFEIFEIIDNAQAAELDESVILLQILMSWITFVRNFSEVRHDLLRKVY